MKLFYPSAMPGTFIDIDDIADVAVATPGTGLTTKLFELTGPRSMTFAECVEAIALKLTTVRLTVRWMLTSKLLSLKMY